MTILALTGGVGGTKLSLGLARTLEPHEVTFVVNVGDDFAHLGLRISPDIDTLTYTLAGIVDETTGWGRDKESWVCLQELEHFEADTWFKLGDRDLALHLYRTGLLNDGKSLTEVTDLIRRRLGIQHRIVPATDTSLQTRVVTDQGTLAFQDYFVRQQCKPVVQQLEYVQNGNASLSDAIEADEVSGVIICPSNPFLSVDPMLAIDELHEMLRDRDFPVVAVSPIVGDRAIKGPTAKMMAEMNMPTSCFSIAQHYREFVDGFVIDDIDAEHAAQIESTGMRVRIAPSIMRTIQDKVSLANVCVEFLDALK